MIQFNLLPDVKKEYIRVKRQKHLLMTVSLVSAAAALVVTGLLFSYVQFGQKSHIDDLTADVNAEISAINSIEDFNQILTIQNQLNALPELHQSKPETSRIFAYLNQITPTDVRISGVNLDILNQQLTIEGTADDLVAINRYIDTIKFSTYTTSDLEDGSPFYDVLSELNRSEDSASYQLSMFFEPIIFDNTVEVTLAVPDQVTTRSVTERPAISSSGDALFENVTDGEDQ